jgi:hypothetical protein
MARKKASAKRKRVVIAKKREKKQAEPDLTSDYPYKKAVPEKLMFGLFIIVAIASVLFVFSGADSPTGAIVTDSHLDQQPYPELRDVDNSVDDDAPDDKSLEKELQQNTRELKKLRVEIQELRKSIQKLQ